MVPANVKTPSAKASTNEAIWVANNIFRFSRRSAAQPPSGDNSAMGACEQKPATHSSTAEPDSL